MRVNTSKYSGRGDPITWPPNSPSLTPLHFFSKYIKDAVYVSSLPSILPQLDGKTPAAATTVTPTMVRSVWTLKCMTQELNHTF